MIFLFQTDYFQVPAVNFPGDVFTQQTKFKPSDFFASTSAFPVDNRSHQKKRMVTKFHHGGAGHFGSLPSWSKKWLGLFVMCYLFFFGKYLKKCNLLLYHLCHVLVRVSVFQLCCRWTTDVEIEIFDLKNLKLSLQMLPASTKNPAKHLGVENSYSKHISVSKG